MHKALPFDKYLEVFVQMPQVLRSMLVYFISMSECRAGYFLCVNVSGCYSGNLDMSYMQRIC